MKTNRTTTAMLGMVVIALLAGGAYLTISPLEVNVTALEQIWESISAQPTTGRYDPTAAEARAMPITSVTTEGATSGLSPVSSVKQVVADAKVMPAQSAELSFLSDGIVSEVLVTEGDQVKADQLLVRLNATRQEAAVAEAEARLRRSQAELAELEAGPRTQEIEVASAAVKAVQAQLAKLTLDTLPEEIEAAEATLASAQATLQDVLEGPVEDEITIAAVDLRQADIALKHAQWAYDEVAYADDVGESAEAARLQQATLRYEAALANYNLAMRGATQADIAAAKSRLAQAKASLALLRRGPNEADIAAAEAEIQRAQAQLELIEAGARPETLAAAEAAVAAAQAALEEEYAVLAETELRAPFAGTITAVDVIVGERAARGKSIVRLADLSTWQIETEDLTELYVIEVSEGDPVIITFDAILGLELSGRVSHIEAMGENRQGEVTYTVVIEPDRQDERLRWFMTALVAIQPE
jgi:HlyD family secretion protein